MFRPLGQTIVALTVAISAGLAPPAHAGDSRRKAARTMIDRGSAEYNLGHFERAIELFESAYAIDPSPIILFDIGQCQRQAGNEERALFFYRRYLAEAPAASDRAEVEQRIADLERSLEERRAIKLRPPPGVVPSPPRETRQEVSRAPAATSTATVSAVAGGDGPGQRWVRLGAEGGVALPTFAGRPVSEPTLGLLELSADYRLASGARRVGVGLLVSYAPLPYQTISGVNEISSLWGAYLTGGYRRRLAGSFHAGVTVAAGLLWWSGLGDGDPFTAAGGGATGAIPMPSFRVGLSLDHDLGKGFYVSGGPAYAFARTTTAGLTSAISAIHFLELSAGLGYAF